MILEALIIGALVAGAIVRAGKAIAAAIRNVDEPE